MILPLMLIFVFSARAEGFMVGVGFTVEVFAETLSHSMSYSRLMALGHAQNVDTKQSRIGNSAHFVKTNFLLNALNVEHLLTLNGRHAPSAELPLKG